MQKGQDSMTTERMCRTCGEPIKPGEPPHRGYLNEHYDCAMGRMGLTPRISYARPPLTKRSKLEIQRLAKWFVKVQYGYGDTLPIRDPKQQHLKGLDRARQFVVEMRRANGLPA